MGKVDDLRAMREARYAAATRTLKAAPAAPDTSHPASPATSPATPPRAVKKAALRIVTEAETVTSPESAGTEPAALFAVPAGFAAEPEAETDLCGHRAISGKTCIRENKHAVKNHKYAKS